MAGLGERSRRAWRAMPPPPRELAVGLMVGGSALALANAVDIAVAVPFTGVRPRLLLHLVDAVLCLGGAAWLSLIFASLAKIRGGWLAIFAASVVAMGFVLGRELLRQANVPFESGLRHPLLVLYVALTGAAVPAAPLAGAWLARLGGRGLALGLALGAGGIALGHLVLRDDYPGVHTAVLWVSATLFGAAAAPRLMRRWRPDARQLVAVVTLAAAALVPPRNAVRCELFRQPGAVVPWVLARIWWTAPRIASAAPPPQVEPLTEAAFREARWDLADEPMVVLITIDALRADVIASGRFDDRLPTLARLRDEGAFFSQAIAPGSQTSVSLTSLFSGRHYSFLRWAYHGRGRSRYHYAAVDPTVRFPAILTASGVTTASVLSLPFLADEYGVTRGFAEETIVGSGKGHAEAALVMTPLLQLVRQRGEGPAFFFAHLTEPHEPYDRATREGTPFERYVAEVALVDRWLDRLLRSLRRRRTYLIVTADHGEAFGEHGRYFHTKSLYDEMVAVPLILWGPGIARRRIERPVSLMDLGPTVLHLFGFPAPEHAMGRSLLPLARGLSEEHPSPVFAEGRLQRAYWRDDGLKVIEDTERKTVEVYDLSRDPAETENIFGREPRADPAVAELRAFFAAHALPGYEPPFKP
jgi:arylsulfatase A-like enzyme